MTFEAAVPRAPEVAAAPAPPPDAPPDWEAGAADVACPLCGYNLRGLTDPRCPECGYRFTWAELRDPSRRLHPYLFEHHPTRPIWSFWRTAVGGLRPFRFWQSLTPVQPVRAGRLFAYWVVAMTVALAGMLGPYAAEWAHLNDLARNGRLIPPAVVWNGIRFVSAPSPPPPARVLISNAVASIGPAYVVWWAFACAWPWATFLTLMIFRVTMRQAKIDSAHVRRSVLYSADAAMWGGACVLIASAVSIAAGGDQLWRGAIATTAGIALPLVSLLPAVRLAVAYRSYLRFPQAEATVFLSQVIVGLAFLIVLINWSLVR